MSKIFIFGSCVTRDAFSFSPRAGLSVANYVARSSLASAFLEKPVDASVLALLDRIASPFQRRMVETDLLKKVTGELERDESDMLLLDLIDERFNLMAMGDTYVTRSPEFARLGLDQGEAGDVVLPDSELHWVLWTEGADKLLALVGERRLVLNCPFWANKRSDGEDMPNVAVIYKNNLLLQAKYDYLISHGVRERICYPEHLLQADPEHKWGLSPFHYRQQFYVHTMDELGRLVGSYPEDVVHVE